MSCYLTPLCSAHRPGNGRHLSFRLDDIPSSGLNSVPPAAKGRRPGLRPKPYTSVLKSMLKLVRRCCHWQPTAAYYFSRHTIKYRSVRFGTEPGPFSHFRIYKRFSQENRRTQRPPKSRSDSAQSLALVSDFLVGSGKVLGTLCSGCGRDVNVDYGYLSRRHLGRKNVSETQSKHFLRNRKSAVWCSCFRPS